MFKARDGIGERGEQVEGPPWILGHRGTPREAPENTLVSLRRALDLGLDGVEYDLHGCASGEPVVIHDETLERTTDGHGAVALLTLPELAGIDAGGWFSKRFAGEPLPLLEEALELTESPLRTSVLHMIELKDPALVSEVVRQVRQVPRPLPVRIASFDRQVCLEARDLGLPSMLLTVDADEDDRRFVRDARLAAYGTGPGGWRTRAGRAEWECERWSWSVDTPDELLAACRWPLFGFNTNHPLRALAVRALVQMTPDDDGPYPVRVDPLEVPLVDPTQPRPAEDDGRTGALHGGWSGSWKPRIRLRNPFGFRVELALALAPGGGAFEVEGLPVELELAPNEETELGFSLRGGSWSPGEDPLLYARFVWRSGPGRPHESLILEAPVVRVRTLRLGRDTVRLPLLAERPGDPEASMTLRRRGRDLLSVVENAAGAVDVRALLRLGVHVQRGARGVRMPLPEWARPGELLPFSVGFEGRADEHGERAVLRRWAGGLPGDVKSGEPGRLILDDEA